MSLIDKPSLSLQKFTERVKTKHPGNICSNQVDESGADDHVVDLQKLISDRGFYVGKDGFDKNLKNVTGWSIYHLHKMTFFFFLKCI